MTITEIDFELDLDAAYGVELTPPGPRTAGLHASDLYGGLARKLDPKRFEAFSTGPNKVIMAIGLAWEQWLERTLIGMGEVVTRPPEQCVLLGSTPCYYSPDLFVVNGHPRIGEMKTTSKSSKHGIEGEKSDIYHAQTMLYCYWEGLEDARFYTLNLRGDYKSKKKGAIKGLDDLPEFHVYDVHYSAQELQDNHETHFQFGKHEGLIQV